MPSAHQLRRTANERLAREKALHTHVYISGLTGHHTLETGLAYFYRGHYIYAYPAGNLIEPIPYSTRKGIMIQGIVSESAPGYDDAAKGLVEEETIRALSKSVEGEMAARKEGEAHAVAFPDNLPASSPSITPKAPPRASSAEPKSTPTLHSPHDPLTTSSRTPSLTSLTALRDPPLFTPQPGLSFLAASAPGSRLASRSVSPSGLRVTGSHISLSILQSRALGLRSNSQSCEGDCGADVFPERTLSRLTGGLNGEALGDSRASIRGNAMGKRWRGAAYLPGLGDHALASEDLGPSEGVATAPLAKEGGLDGSATATISAASGARVRPCALHGEDCDGLSTERAWDTEEMRLGRGFVEDVPLVDNGGRVMVDWVGLLEEVRGGKGA